MLRAFRIRRSQHRRYERLGDETSAASAGLLEGELQRTKKSLPADVFASSSNNKLSPESLALPSNLPQQVKGKPNRKGSTSKNIHPLLSLFDGRRKKKTTAKPEFARYLEYVKEGGVWDTSVNVPVIYYK